MTTPVTHEIEPDRILAHRMARPLTAEELLLVSGGMFSDEIDCNTTYDTNNSACDCDR